MKLKQQTFHENQTNFKKPKNKKVLQIVCRISPFWLSMFQNRSKVKKLHDNLEFLCTYT